MALIKCPECGGNLSSTVNQCVHCGCKLKVCSECGTVSIADDKCCPNCGYQTVEKQEGKRQVSFDKISDATKSWSSKSVLRKIYTGNNYIAIATYVLSFIFLFITLIRVIVWKSGDTLSGVFEASSLQTSLNSLYVFFAIFFAIAAFLLNFRTYYFATDFGKWLKYNQIDGKNLLYKYMNSNFEKMNVQQIVDESIEALNVLLTLTMQSDIAFRLKKRNTIIISTCLNILRVGLLCATLITVADAYMQYVFFGSGKSFVLEVIFQFGEDSFLQKNFVLLIATLLIFVVYAIYDKIQTRKEQTAMDAWISKNMPEKYAIYDKYMKKLTDFIVNTAENK